MEANMRTRYLGALLVATLAGTACEDTAVTDPAVNFDLQCSIPTDDLFTGARRDAIPALTNPELQLHSTFGISDTDRVLGVVIGEAARAYPLRILWSHEIVNDTLGGEPVLVSYCPLTGSGLAFDPVIDGELRDFGVSGLLYENNLVMYDRQTQSLWNQLLLGAQCGPERGQRLQSIPVVETTLAHWQQLYPQTTVVTINTGYPWSYQVYPYGDYDEEDNSLTLFPSSEYSRSRPPKELVLGVSAGGIHAAYPFGTLADRGNLVTVNDELGSADVLVIYEGASRTARAFDRIVDEQLLTFSVADTSGQILTDAETGSRWDLKGNAVSGPLAGTSLAPIAKSYTLFWFAWSVYHPNSVLFR
jgi:hypothetical protein